jgi:hypothetical protein
MLRPAPLLERLASPCRQLAPPTRPPVYGRACPGRDLPQPGSAMTTRPNHPLPRQDLHLQACQRPKAAHRKLLFWRAVGLTPRGSGRIAFRTRSKIGPCWHMERTGPRGKFRYVWGFWSGIRVPARGSAPGASLAAEGCAAVEPALERSGHEKIASGTGQISTYDSAEKVPTALRGVMFTTPPGAANPSAEYWLGHPHFAYISCGGNR